MHHEIVFISDIHPQIIGQPIKERKVGRHRLTSWKVGCTINFHAYRMHF